MDPKDEKKTERVVMRVGPTMKALLEQRAREDHRDVAEWARLQLERAAEKRGRR